MEVVVSVLAARNLSQSPLILRNLYSILEVADCVHNSPQLEVNDVRFKVPSVDASLLLTVKNGQTQTSMFVRSVPLDFALGSPTAQGVWLAVYEPGDARNLTFDLAPPRTDVPQVHLSIRSTGQLAGSPPRTGDRMAFSVPTSSNVMDRSTDGPRPFASPRASYGGAGASLDRLSIREKELQAEDIKAKVAGLAEKQRQGRATEQELQEVACEIRNVQADIDHVEQELRRLTTQKQAAECEEKEARDGVGMVRESLRKKELSILELRSHRDESQRQLNRVLQEHDQVRSSKELEIRSFDQEVKGMATELDRWKSEAASISEQLQRVDRRVSELHGRGAARPSSSPAGGPGAPGRGRAELRALQEQLDEAQRELEEARREAAETAGQAGEAEGQDQAARARLLSSEAAVADAKKRLSDKEASHRRRAIELRAEATAKEKELIHHMSQAALLEGQVGESRIQVRDVQARARSAAEQIQVHRQARDELAGTLSELTGQLDREEREKNRAVSDTALLEARVKKARDQLAASRAKSSSLAGRGRELEDAHARETLELDSTRRVQQHMLKAAGDEARRFRDDQERLKQAISPMEARLESCVQTLDETRQRGDAVERELEGVRSETLRRAQEQEREAARLAELAVELEAAILELQRADAEAEQMRGRAQLDTTQRVGRVQALEEECDRLAGELAEQRALQRQWGCEQEALARSLERSRALEPIREEEAGALRSAGASLQEEGAQLEAAVREARERLSEQLAAVERLRESMSEEQQELGALGAAAAEGERRREQLLQAQSTSQAFWSGRREFVQKELEEIQSRTHDTQSQLSHLCAQRSHIAGEHDKAVEACRQASQRIRQLQADIGNQKEASAQRVSDLAAEAAKHDLEEADLNRGRGDLEEQLASLERHIAGELGELSRVEEALASRRREAAEHAAGLQALSQELESTQGVQAATADRLSELRAREGGVRRRAAELREQHAALRAAAARAQGLHRECDALSASQQLRRAEHGRRLAALDAEIEGLRGGLASAGDLAGKGAELEQHRARIDELEREIGDQVAKVEALRAQTGQLQRQLGAAEAEERQARAEDEDRVGRLAGLQQELSELEQSKQGLQQSAAAAEGRVAAALEATTRVEEDFKKRDADLADLVAKARDLAEECQGRVAAVRGEVLAQERQRNAAADDALRLTAEVQALVGSREEASRRLEEKSCRRDARDREVARLELELQQAAAETRAAHEEAEGQIVAICEQEREAGEMGGRLAAEEQKATLLKEQLSSREATLQRALVERAELEAMCAELAGEVDQLRVQASTIIQQLSHQEETSRLQFAAVGPLEEELRRAESEESILLRGLQEADQMYEFLQKEHDLIQQQVGGGYQGTLAEWAEELLGAKARAEAERRAEELGHWKQVAETAEKELLADVEAATRKHNEDEVVLKQKLDSLAAELPQVQRRLDALSLNQQMPEAAGDVHSVPAPLHGLLEARPRSSLSRQRALIIGCNYSDSHAPLQGCTNDAWNVHCLLRHTLGYSDDQVVCLIDVPSSPSNRLPTRANILSGLQWLTADARQEDSVALFFSGYGTQQPVHGADGVYQALLVPSDFAADLPEGFALPDARLRPSLGEAPALAGSGAYRLLPLVELTAALSRLPVGCRATVIMDCCHAAVPGVDASQPQPGSFSRIARDLELGDLQALQPRLQPRFLDLPPRASAPPPAAVGALACCCHCYAACQSSQWCAELPIEGCVQGAFTWAFVKALVAGHLNTTVEQHMKAMHAILANLQQHFRWVEQTPLLQLSAAAGPRDAVLAA